jgi:RecA-family ATPase
MAMFNSSGTSKPNGQARAHGLRYGLAPETVARQLGGSKARRSGNGWLTCCPAHDDDNPSLSVSSGDNGGLIFYCHAGCTQEALLGALEWHDIGAAPPREPTRTQDGAGSIAALQRNGYRITTVYDYQDEAGILLYQNVRLERYARDGRRTDKTFRQRRPNPTTSGWIENLTGLRRLPYRLPELMRRPEKDVHLTEGEKDADNLAKLGLLSTSIATPTKTDLSVLRGRIVYIHEDNDSPGRDKSAKMAAALHGIAAQIVIVQYLDAGDGGDVSDWLGQDRGLEQLLVRIEEADTATRNAPAGVCALPYESRCLAEVKPEPISWLWHGRIALGKLNLLAGQPGFGKSQLTIFMAGKVSVGGQWPDGRHCPQGSVILISCEDDANDTIVPRLMAVGADRARVHTLDWVLKTGDDRVTAKQLFNLGANVPVLANLVRQLGDVRLIVIDPVSAYLGRLDSHKASDVRGCLAPLQQLAAETGAAVVLVSHLNKGSADASPMARVAGSGAFVAACRSAWLVEADPQDENGKRRILTPLKDNIGDDQTGFAFHTKPVRLAEEIETSCIVFESEPVTVSAVQLLRSHQETDEDRGAVGEAMDFLRDYLASGPKNSKSTQKAAEEAGIAPRTLRRARERLKVKSQRSRTTSQWVWLLPEHVEHPSRSTDDVGQFDQHGQAARDGQFCSVDHGTTGAGQVSTPENHGQDGQEDQQHPLFSESEQ